MNLTQGGEISQDSDKEEEIRPSKILPQNFNIKALDVKASKGTGSSE